VGRGPPRPAALFESQFQLLDLAVELLRARAELPALQLRDDELEVLDLDGALTQERLLREHQRLERFEVFGNGRVLGTHGPRA
jgi:hypothetical protein